MKSDFSDNLVCIDGYKFFRRDRDGRGGGVAFYMFTYTTIAFAFLFSFALTADQNDEGKPYEFGFTIDGQQHRHESKDANGIIQGEFGFITADGVYHVTVYATDENGNFKILSMKNIRLSGPLDGSGGGKYGGSAVGVSSGGGKATVPNSALNNVSPKANLVSTHRPFTTQPTIKPACGGCGYVTTQKYTTLANNIYNSRETDYNKQQGPKLQQYSEGPTKQSNENTKYSDISANQPSPITGERNQVTKESDGNANIPNSQTYQQKPSTGINNQGETPTYPNTQIYQQNPVTNIKNQINMHYAKQRQSSGLQNINDSKIPGNKDVDILSGPQKIEQNDIPYKQQDPLALVRNEPLTKLPNINVADGVIHVEGKTDIPIKDKYPGMVDGLPDGVSEKDVKDILYKFKYTVGFHGHYEKGLKNGAKVGGYFVNGRDGVSRVVTYVADENGYRPRVKFIRLDLNSDEVPKEETEKTFGLKEFEFVWYPIN